MRFYTSTIAAVVLIVSPVSAAPFVNLDFEQATIVPYYEDDYHLIDINHALPGWGPFAGDSIYYGGIHLSTGPLTLLTDKFGPKAWHQFALEGRFSMVLTGGQFSDASIFQTGDVPATAKSIQLLSKSHSPDGIPIVMLDDTVIPLVVLEETSETIPHFGGRLTRYGGDVTSFAGTTAMLTITKGGIVDDITFSPVAVPEPSSILLGLMASVATLLAAKRLRRC